MKKKFLSLAVITAVLSMLVMHTVSAQSSAGSDSEVQVDADTTLTIELNGEMEAVTITGITAGVPDDTGSESLSWGDSDLVRITDFTGTSDSGHEIVMYFDSGTWTYDDTNSAYDDVAVSGSPDSDDIIMFEVLNDGAGGTFNFSPKAGSTCSWDATTKDLHDITVTTATDREFAQTDETCPGYFHYTPDRFKVTAGDNGLGDGSYTISGTLAVTDGQS